MKILQYTEKHMENENASLCDLKIKIASKKYKITILTQMSTNNHI